MIPSKFNSLEEIEAFLYQTIPPHSTRFSGELGIKRARYLMGLLGNPQEKIKVIHIAGTTGKGSTAYFVSSILSGLDFKVGMTISPHVLDFRERFQINGKYISQMKLITYFNNFLKMYRKMGKSEYGFPTYFGIIQSIAYVIFAEEKVDYAIVEVGLGGTFDTTNVIDSKNKTCLITRIGLDHTDILGNKISDIASQKAGIIQRGNAVLSTGQRKSAEKVLVERCKDMGASLDFIKSGDVYKKIRLNDGMVCFDYNYGGLSIKRLCISTQAYYQAHNFSLALSCVKYLSERDRFEIDTRKIRHIAAHTYFPGRFDVKEILEKQIIIDGAHNPQKMRGFLNSLIRVFPTKKYDFIIAFKRGKDFTMMLRQILPYASRVYLTSFLTNSNLKEDLFLDEKIVKTKLRDLGFGDVCIVHDASKSLILALKNKTKIPIVVTGSLYLSSEIYKAIDKLTL